MNQNYPVIVIGAGPIGLAAAAHLIERNQDVRVLEAGTSAGAAIAEWGTHQALLHLEIQHRRRLPPPAGNTHRDLRRRLGSAPRNQAAHRCRDGHRLPRTPGRPPGMAPVISYGHRVTDLTRIQADGHGVDKARSAGREDSLFLVRTQTATGTEDILARAVIDASGTWNTPNPVGRSGIEAIGEAAARSPDSSPPPLPDPLGAGRERFAGKTVLVLGAGHSAANTLISLGRLRQQHPDTTILWGLRGSGKPGPALRRRGRRRTSGPRPTGHVPAPFRRKRRHHPRRERRRDRPGNRQAVGACNLADGRSLAVDLLVPATGFRPDLGMLSELRLDLDEIVEAPRELGPLIDPEFHSCGTVAAHGDGRTGPPGNELLHRRHEELRPRPDLPDGHRLRTGPFDRSIPGRRPCGRGSRGARTARNRRVFHRPWRLLRPADGG